MSAFPVSASISSNDRSPRSLTAADWVLLIAAALAMAGLGAVVMVVVPSYQAIFAEFGVKLPWTTEAMLRISGWLNGSNPRQIIAGAAIVVPLALMTLAGSGMLAARRNQVCRRAGLALLISLLACSLTGVVAVMFVMQGPLGVVINALQGNRP